MSALALSRQSKRGGWPLGGARGRVCTLVLIGGVVSVAAGVYRGPRVTCRFSTEDRAELTVKKLAFEAFPSWLAEDSSRRCPEQLEDLLLWMNEKDIIDPWGRDYRFRCTATSDKPLAVWSAGPDRRHGTDDDVRSY